MFGKRHLGLAATARRATGIFVAASVGYSAAPIGFNWMFGGTADFVKGEIAKIQGYPRAYKDRPIARRVRTSQVGRNEFFRGGIKNAAELADLVDAEQARYERYLQDHPELLYASLMPDLFPAAYVPPGGGGEPEEGEGMGGLDTGTSFADMHEDDNPKPADWIERDCWPNPDIACPGGDETDGLGGPPGGGGGGGGGANDVGAGEIQLNTNTGNLVTTVGITGWSGKGDSYIDFTLVHNSRQSQTLGAITDIGHSWTHSYSIEVNYVGSLPPSQGAPAYLIWIDGQRIKFTYNGIHDPQKGWRFDPPAGYHAYLYLPVGGYTLTTKDGWTYTFNGDGHVIEQTDPWGNDVTISRNQYNEITTVSDGLERSLAFTYVGGKISRVDAPDGKYWQFVRGDGANLTKIKYPELNAVFYETNFGYNGYNDITSYTNTLGKTWSYTYTTPDGKLTSVTNPLTRTWTVTYGLDYARIYNPLGESVWHYYEDGRLISYKDEANYVVNFWADADENLTRVQDKRGKFWDWTYDSNANLLTAKDPNDRTWTYTYNSQNNLTTVKNPEQNTVVTIGYSNGIATLPAPTSVTDPLYEPIKRYGYSSTGELTAVMLDNPTGMGSDQTLAVYTYDAYKNVTEVENPITGVSVSATYDLLGRPETVTDSANQTTTVHYDDWSRPWKLVLPDTSDVRITYNQGSQVTAAYDQLNRSGSVQYDDAGYVTSATNAENEVTTFAYDWIGRMTGVTNARGKTRTYAYTVRHEVYTLTLPDSTTESWSYDANGNVASYTNGELDTIAYTYNDSGDQTTVDYPTGTDTVFGYDANGNWNSMTDATGVSSWVFNVVGQVTSLTTPQGSFSYTYNPWGQPWTMTDSSGVWTTVYNDVTHRAEGMTNPWNETTSVTFDSAGRVNRKDLPNGMYETYHFDSRSRVDEIKTYNSSGIWQDTKAYVWDAASRITQATEGGVATTYGYDDIDQLLSESRSGYSASYTYDANGNRLTRTVNSVTETYAYDDADKLLSVSIGQTMTKEYEYDDAGRTTSMETSAGFTSFTYDYESRVTSITYPNQTSDSHTYNGLDARVGSSGTNGTKTFRRNGIGATSPVMSDGSINYTPGVSSRSGSTSKFQHSGIKNATEQSNSSQTVTATKKYDAYGNLASSSGSWQGAFGYGGDSGYQEDASGLKLLGHRYYDSSTGRFLTRDPSHSGKNWYRYAGNNPVSFSDANGLKEQLLLIVGDTNGSAGMIWAASQVWIDEMKEQYGDDYDIVVLIAPSRDEAMNAMVNADAVMFFGHGSHGRIDLRGGGHPQVKAKDGKKGSKNKAGGGRQSLYAGDFWEVWKRRQKKGKGKYNFIMVRCCFTLSDKDDGNMRTTLRLQAYKVGGYMGITAESWGWPYQPQYWDGLPGLVGSGGD